MLSTSNPTSRVSQRSNSDGKGPKKWRAEPLPFPFGKMRGDVPQKLVYWLAGVVALVVMWQLRDIQTSVHAIKGYTEHAHRMGQDAVAGHGVYHVKSAAEQLTGPLDTLETGPAPPGRATAARLAKARPAGAQTAAPKAVTTARAAPAPAAKAAKAANAAKAAPAEKAEKAEAPAAMSRPARATPDKEQVKAEQAKAKADFVWPVPLPAWKLVPDSEKDTMPLPGEGMLSDELMNMERSGYGILYNAIHRDPTAKRPSKSIVAAVKGAHRMRAAVEERRALNASEAATLPEIKFILFTEQQPLEFMKDKKLCRDLWPECKGFAEGFAIFDKVVYYESLTMPTVIERRERFQTWPELWVKRIMASLNSPFAKTMVVDSDVYGCTNFQDIFTKYLGDDADVAATLAPAPFGASRNYDGAFRPGFPKSYAKYTERNLGLHILATGNKRVLQLLALFRDAYVRQVNDTKFVSIGNDQCAFREAMWTMRDNFGLVESTIPAEHGCRHETGCADGCMVVHRHQNPEMSKAQLKVLKAEKRKEKQAKVAADKVAAADV